MIDGGFLQVWSYRALFLLLAGGLALVALLPINTAEPGIPRPDLLLCLVAAWTLRRPDFAPLWLIAVAGLVLDFLLFRPPGSWTLALILAAETLNRQAQRDADPTFAVEMVQVAAAVAVAHVVNRVLLVLVGAPRPSAGAVVIEILFTLLAYPLVAVVSVLILRVRRPDPQSGFGF